MTAENLAYAPTRRGWLKAAGLGAAALGTGYAGGVAPAAAAPVPTPVAPSAALANMALNENPFGPSPKMAEAIIAAIPRVNRYADDDTAKFAKMVADMEQVDPSQIVVANGSTPILAAFGEMIGETKGQLVTSMATYEAVPATARAYGAEVIFAPLSPSYGYDLDAMLQRLGPKTTASYVCNPNNPTGNMVDPVKLRAFAIEASKKGPVFIDEAYIHIAYGYESSVMTGLVRDGHNVIVCRTFSKLFAMAGQRLGYAIAPPDIAKKMQTATRLGGVNRLALAAGMASLSDVAWQEQTRAKITRNRNKLVSLARELGRTYALDPQSNCVFMDVGMPNTEFAQKMAAEGVRVVGRTWPGYEKWTRLSVGLDEDHDRCRTAAIKVLHA